MKYHNLRYWDGLSNGLTQDDLCVEQGRFVAPDAFDGQQSDLQGCTAIPGLIDAHIHLCLDPDIKDPFEQTAAGEIKLLEGMRQRASSMLQAGITTARDLGGGDWLELQVRDEIEAGQTLGPRLVCAGQPITSKLGHCHFWGGEAENLEEALIVLDRQCEHGADLIKIMVTGGNITPGSRPVDSQFDDETVMKLVAAASEKQKFVAAHCHGTDGIRQAAEAGVRTVEHCSWVGEAGWGRALDEQGVQTLATHGVYVSPTINAGWRRFKSQEFVDLVRSNYQKLKAAGVELIASTDAGIPNVYHHDLPRALPEFARFAELTPVEALRTATSCCAAAIGLGNLTGAIRAGVSADYVVYEGNPLEDLAALENPVLVVSKGIAHEVG